jgi:hypothetical protein
MSEIFGELKKSPRLCFRYFISNLFEFNTFFITRAQHNNPKLKTKLYSYRSFCGKISNYFIFTHALYLKKIYGEIKFFFCFTTSLIWLGGQFCHQVISVSLNRSCGGSNCDPPYQVQRQSPLNN